MEKGLTCECVQAQETAVGFFTAPSLQLGLLLAQAVIQVLLLGCTRSSSRLLRERCRWTSAWLVRLRWERELPFCSSSDASSACQAWAGIYWSVSLIEFSKLKGLKKKKKIIPQINCETFPAKVKKPDPAPERSENWNGCESRWQKWKPSSSAPLWCYFFPCPQANSAPIARSPRRTLVCTVTSSDKDERSEELPAGHSAQHGHLNSCSCSYRRHSLDFGSFRRPVWFFPKVQEFLPCQVNV